MEKLKRTFGFIFNHSLGKKHPFKVLMRFVLWQLQSKWSGGFFIKPFIAPLKFYARKGLTGITGNIYTGLHEFADMTFLLHLLTPADFFFDVGANVGSYTLLAAGICRSKCVALEPVGSTFEILQKNIALNGLQDSVILLNAGAGSENGFLNFSCDEDTTNHVIKSPDEATANMIRVPVVTIDSLLSNGCPLLIKIDVEGFETEVMNGMELALDNPGLKALVIELNGSGSRYGYDEKQIHDVLLSKDYRPYTYDAFTRTLTNVSSYGSYNTIYCRDIAFIEERLKAAKAVNVMGELI